MMQTVARHLLCRLSLAGGISLKWSPTLKEMLSSLPLVKVIQRILNNSSLDSQFQGPSS